MFTKEFKERYVKELGLTYNGDKEEWYNIISKSLARADRVREFEIELYWKRSLYMWGINAAFLAIFVNLISKSFLSEKPNGDAQIFMRYLSVLLSLMAFSISVLWGKLIEGAKFWQNNWERHVDLLEGLYGVNLYQVYPQNTSIQTIPFSVTKINKRIVFIIKCFWLFSLVLTLIKLFGVGNVVQYSLFYITGPLAILFCLAITQILSYKLKMSQPGNVVFSDPKGENNLQTGSVLVSRVVPPK